MNKLNVSLIAPQIVILGTICFLKSNSDHLIALK